jgi:outer membrane protein
MRKIYLIIYITLWSFSGFSQHKWPLEQCIDYAYEHNIQLQQQQINTSINKNNFLQSKLSLLPTISLNANHNYMSGHTIDPFTNEFIPNNSNTENFSLSSSVTLFNGFRMQNNIKYQKFNWLASRQQVEKTKNAIAINVITAYLQFLYAKENLKLAESQKNVSELQLANTTKLYNAGSVSVDNFLDAKAQLENSNLQVVTAENNLSMAKLSLVQQMNLPSGEYADFDIEVPDIEDVDNSLLLLPVDTLVKNAVAKLPDYKAAEYALKASEYSLKMANGNRSPRLFLSVSYGTGYSDSRKKTSYSPVMVPIGIVLPDSDIVYGMQMQYTESDYPFADQLKDNASTTVSIGLSIPLFNGYQTSTQVKNAKLSLYRSKLELENTYNEIYKMVVQARNDAVAAYNKYNATKKSLDAQKKAFENIKKKYEVGLVKYLDFNVAKNNMFKAQNDLLQAKYEYLFKMKILEFYTVSKK